MPDYIRTARLALAELGISYRQMLYLLQRRPDLEPPERINNARIFRDADIARIRAALEERAAKAGRA